MTPVIARLKAQLTGFVAIGGAADLEVAMDATPQAPAAYAVCLAETAEAPYLGAHVMAQRVLCGFAVVMVAQNHRDQKGAAAAVDLAAMRSQVRSALLGWAPVPAEGEPVHYRSGRLLQFARQRLWWSDEFAVYTDARSA